MGLRVLGADATGVHGSTKANQKGMSQGALEPLRMYEQWTKSTNAYEHMVWYVTCMAYAHASVRSPPGQVEIGNGRERGREEREQGRETAMQGREAGHVQRIGMHGSGIQVSLPAG